MIQKKMSSGSLTVKPLFFLGETISGNSSVFGAPPSKRSMEELVQAQCLSVMVLANLLEFTQEREELHTLQVEAILPTISSEKLHDTFSKFLYQRYISFWNLTETILHHSAITVKFTDERFLDFASVCDTHDKYISEIYLFTFSLTQYLDTSEASGRLVNNGNSLSYDGRLPPPPFKKVDRASMGHLFLHELWVSYLGFLNVLSEIYARRSQILGELGDESQLELIPLIRALRCRLDAIKDPTTGKTPREITAELGLPRKCEHTVRNYIRTLQAKGRLPSVVPGKHIRLDNRDYAVAMAYLEKRMKNTIARYRRK